MTFIRLRYVTAYLIILLNSIIQLSAKNPLSGNDELFQTRINSLKLQFEVPYNPVIKTFIDEYLANPDLVKSLVLKSKYYFPVIEKQLKNKNVPTDLKYLAANASQFDATATNSTGATGIWLMAYPVSKMYKLKVTTYVDERRDIIKSSAVAAQHFKDLNSIYKTWPLSIAAYGCSPVMLNKCIRMAGNSLYFWDLYNVMPTYCRDLLPKTIATAYVLNFYKEHGIKIKENEWIPETTDSVLVTKLTSFQQISTALNIPIEDLRMLNPVFKKDVIPFNPNGYLINLPKGRAKDFYLVKDSIFKSEPDVPISVDPIEIKKDNTRNQNTGINPNDDEVKKGKQTSKTVVMYKVKKGDNLGKIADWFDTTQPEIKRLNKLKSNNVNLGQVLKIEVPSNKKAFYQRINSMTARQKKQLGKKD
ncbi:MAG: LysM peptidoglycan-binding domain-containing protein [Bacteroidia bacterium]